VRTRHPASGDLGKPAATEERRIAKPFNGVINLHVRDSGAPVSVDVESDLPRRWRATEEREV
jgi:hypothetical protein